jgi:hypothetical protein
MERFITDALALFWGREAKIGKLLLQGRVLDPRRD